MSSGAVSGTPIAPLASIADGAARGFTVERDGRKHELILVRRGCAVFAYVNACPHLGTPLEIFPDKFLDYTGTRLLCSTHGASFRIADGFCLSGPCEGRSLAAAPISVVDGTVVLTGPVPAPPIPG